MISGREPPREGLLSFELPLKRGGAGAPAHAERMRGNSGPTRAFQPKKFRPLKMCLGVSETQYSVMAGEIKLQLIHATGQIDRNSVVYMDQNLVCHSLYFDILFL